MEMVEHKLFKSLPMQELTGSLNEVNEQRSFTKHVTCRTTCQTHSVICSLLQKHYFLFLSNLLYRLSYFCFPFILFKLTW